MHDQGKFGGAGEHEGFSCVDFDLLLSDAIDGTLAGADLAAFQHHVAECGTCGPMFADTQAGLSWVKVLEPTEVPANLVHNILAATTIADVTARAQVEQSAGWRERATQVLEQLLLPVFNIVRQPRFALNAAMAFFSVSLLLNVGGSSFRVCAFLTCPPVRLRPMPPSGITRPPRGW